MSAATEEERMGLIAIVCAVAFVIGFLAGGQTMLAAYAAAVWCKTGVFVTSNEAAVLARQLRGDKDKQEKFRAAIAEEAGRRMAQKATEDKR